MKRNSLKLLPAALLAALALGAPAAATGATVESLCTTASVFTQGIGYSIWENPNGLGQPPTAACDTREGAVVPSYPVMMITKGLLGAGFSPVPSNATNIAITAKFAVRLGVPTFTWSEFIVSLKSGGQVKASKSWRAGFAVPSEEITPSGDWTNGGPFGWVYHPTAEEVNSPSFGFIVMAERLSGEKGSTETLEISNMTLVVSYSVPGAAPARLAKAAR